MRGHVIPFLRYRKLPGTKFMVALLVIEPSTFVPGPDVVLGLGIRKKTARQNALARAKRRIRCSPER
jgi:hypothetical protein